MSFAFVFVIFLFYDPRITNHGLCVFLFLAFLFILRVQPLKVSFSCCMSFSLAILSILLLPCFSFYFSPTLLFVLYRLLPCFSFYISYYLVLPYLVFMSCSAVKSLFLLLYVVFPCFSFYTSSTSLLFLLLSYLALLSISTPTSLLFLLLSYLVLLSRSPVKKK